MKSIIYGVTRTRARPRGTLLFGNPRTDFGLIDSCKVRDGTGRCTLGVGYETISAQRFSFYEGRRSPGTKCQGNCYSRCDYVSGVVVDQPPFSPHLIPSFSTLQSNAYRERICSASSKQQWCNHRCTQKHTGRGRDFG